MNVQGLVEHVHQQCAREASAARFEFGRKPFAPLFQAREEFAELFEFCADAGFGEVFCLWLVGGRRWVVED